MPEEIEEEGPGYESGPFCRHWSDPADCDELCKNCAHECFRHDGDNDCLACECEQWADSE